MNRLFALVVLPLLATTSVHESVHGQQSPASTCQVTETVDTAAPPATLRELPFPHGPWFINPERTVWAGIGWQPASVLRSEGAVNKVLWIRPEGVPLLLTGRRLDASSPAMRAAVGATRGQYVLSDLYFPTAGCWEVNRCGEWRPPGIRHTRGAAPSAATSQVGALNRPRGRPLRLTRWESARSVCSCLPARRIRQPLTRPLDSLLREAVTSRVPLQRDVGSALPEQFREPNGLLGRDHLVPLCGADVHAHS